MKVEKIKNIGIALLILFSINSLNSRIRAQTNKKNVRGQNIKPNTLTQKEKKNGWKLLFDGKSAKNWREVWGKSFPDKDWIIQDDKLTVLASNGEQGGAGGSIVTKKEYSNFILRVDFNLTTGANSGIKYFVVEKQRFFKTNPNLKKGMGIGLEYQVLDDKNHPDAHGGVNGDRTSGSLYDMIPAAKDKQLNPPGEWNNVKIVSKGNHIEHWLNGQKVLEYKRGSDAFRALVDKSKYKYHSFGQAPRGHILLQNHGTEVSFRNIMIKTLNH